MARVRLEAVSKRFGSVTAMDAVTLDIADGEFFAILGPPGAGKTTTLRAILGLEKPDSGRVLLDDEDVTDMWPGDRDIAIVFQNLALYPDKSVFGNLAFPLKQQKLPKAEISERVQRAAKVLKIEPLLDRKPAKLSGGERQRVAIGRAIVRDPRAYLFDEPLSALDALLRLEMRSELKYLQRDLNRTLVYVTHDQVEAMSMADRMAVLRDGVVQQVATPEDIYHRPVNRFVATTIGSPPMNFLPAVARRHNGAVTIEHPSFAVRVAGGRLELADGAPCFVGVRPEDVHVGGDAAGFEATVFVTEPLGGETVVDLHLGDRVVKALAPATARFDTDALVKLQFDPRRLHVFDAAGTTVASAAGERIFELDAVTV
ncbi:MAG: multiple sugar transport system ATP-binding protein [Gaiellales bacterium]|jgi:multiple sugar transport system ATP-binding protein|nr:multiple sugar transport system ATP-binding protein [Gaiellales bacterium]